MFSRQALQLEFVGCGEEKGQKMAAHGIFLCRLQHFERRKSLGSNHWALTRPGRRQPGYLVKLSGDESLKFLEVYGPTHEIS